MHQQSRQLRKRQFSRTLAATGFAAAALFVPAALVAPSQAQSETLRSALASAYKYNPRIDAERARLRATDEGAAQARSGYRPTISGTADVSAQDSNIEGGGLFTSLRGGRTNSRGYGIQLQQNIFTGFQTTNAVREAEANIRAAREQLREVERGVLLEAVTAYMDVIRDQAVVRLQENNVRVLSRELRATQDRFDVGEVTRTDVAQAQARRAGALSALDFAKANLKTSRANYLRVVGTPANNLVEPSLPSKYLPKSLESALANALNDSPTLIRALYTEQAARIAVDRIRGQLLPQATLEAAYTDQYNSGDGATSDRTETTSVVGRLTMPFYQGGRVHSEVRQAKQNHIATLQEIEDARTLVRRDVTQAWSQLTGSQAQLESDRVQVRANQTALTGVREEERVGQRTLLDVLNAEQELLNSQVQEATTKRDVIVNSYAVLSAVGRLDSATLGLTSYVYDPDVHYHEVRRKWWGIRITHRDGREESHDLWDRFGRQFSYK